MEKNSFNATWVGTLPAAVQTFLNGRGGKGDVYAYDWAYRLVDARYDVTNPATEVTSPGSQTYVKLVQYGLDGVGNRTQVQLTPPTPPTSTSYASDVMNQYTTVGGVSRTHDLNGNVSDDGTYQWKYDYLNRVTEVINKGTAQTIATYRTDPLGRRVEKAISGGATTRYLLDGQHVVEEYDGSDAWKARYVFEDGWDQPRSMDRADVADVDGDANTTEVLRFHYAQNALGSVSELSQPSGAVVEWTTYDVYGMPTIRNAQGGIVSLSAVGNPFLFTGREWEAESATYSYRARQYDPERGRFLQRDPSGYVDGLGLYLYCSAAPTTRVDPAGLDDDGPAPWVTRPWPGDSKEDQAKWGDEQAQKALEEAKKAYDAGDKGAAREWLRAAAAMAEYACYCRDYSEFDIFLGGLGAGLLAFAIEELTDPLNYIPGGAVAKGGGRLVKLVKKAVKGAEGAAEAGRDVAKVVDKAAEAERAADKAADAAAKGGKVYEVPGSDTPSGKPYVGRTTQPEPKSRGKADGRDRSKARVVDEYDPKNTPEGRLKEQDAIDRAGGVDKLDNKRNEVAPEKRAEVERRAKEGAK